MTRAAPKWRSSLPSLRTWWKTARPPRFSAPLRPSQKRALDYEFGPTRARVVFACAKIISLSSRNGRRRCPSLMRNRMPLRLLTGPQALEAVVRPGRMEGRNLVSEEVGAQIVRFVARRTVETPLEEIEAVPALVSLHVRAAQ